MNTPLKMQIFINISSESIYEAGECTADLQSAEKNKNKKMNNDINVEVEEALHEVGLSHFQAIRLALELVEQCGARGMRGDCQMNHCRLIMRLGAEQYLDTMQSVSFAQAASCALKERLYRRPRTVAEFSSVCRRLLRSCPSLNNRFVNSLKPSDCADVLYSVFSSARQRRKGRAIMHGVFAYAVRQRWCAYNPMEAVRLPPPEEREITPLSLQYLRRLLIMANTPVHRACMPALGLMLWCGIRPAEIERLKWSDLDFDEKIISVRPCHSKTGGCRHVPLRPVVLAWLRTAGVCNAGYLCPPDWQRRWRRLREAAGLIPWQQDVLRHTFASYHAKQFHDFSALQSEMGHRSASLLRTRYLNMQGLTTEGAEVFWREGALWKTR